MDSNRDRRRADTGDTPAVADRQASGPERSAAKAQRLWRVSPVNDQEPPFHYSNTPGVMLIAAPDAETARRMAVSEAGDTAWQDKDRVRVDEYAPSDAMVLTRNFAG